MVELKYDIVAKNIRDELKKYIIDNKLKSLVIGVSGGIDSTVCCLLAKPVCNELNIPLIGRSLPIESNEDEVERALNVGMLLCHNFKERSIVFGYTIIKELLEEFEESPEEDDLTCKIRRGNIKARTRMIYLYNLAQLHGGMVLGTDNLTEYELGFWTLHGDVGDYGMIQNLWKTEVYQLAKYIARFEYNDGEYREAIVSCINALASDGLGISDGGDLDQLKANSYKEVDNLLQKYFVYNQEEQKNHPVIQKHLKSKFKRKVPVNLKRDIILKNAL